MASGIILIIFRNMKVGDSIQIGNLSGTVKEINILFSKIFFPKLTTIDTDVDQLAEEAVDQLIRRIKNEVNLNRSARKTLIPVELIKRDTHK